MTIDVFWLPGTGFSTGPDGISAAFGAALDGSRFNFIPLRYPADFGVRMSYEASVLTGRQVLVNAIRATPNRVICGGYSQGAAVAGCLAAAIGRGEYSDLDVLACALIADPARPPGAGCPGLPTASGYGISGARYVDGLPTYWAAAQGDPITALPAGNPLRSVADLTVWMTLASPGDAQKWGADLLDRAIHGRWQRWWSLENRRTWAGAIAYARGYLIDGRHTFAYLDEGLAVGLAHAINEAAAE